jgi:hypothetical protein
MHCGVSHIPVPGRQTRAAKDSSFSQCLNAVAEHDPAVADPTCIKASLLGELPQPDGRQRSASAQEVCSGLLETHYSIEDVP